MSVLLKYSVMFIDKTLMDSCISTKELFFGSHAGEFLAHFKACFRYNRNEKSVITIA